MKSNRKTALTPYSSWHPLSRRMLMQSLVGVMYLPLGFPALAADSQPAYGLHMTHFQQFMRLSETLTGIKSLDSQLGRLIWDHWINVYGLERSVHTLASIETWLITTEEMNLSSCDDDVLKRHIRELVIAWYLPKSTHIGDIKPEVALKIAQDTLVWRVAGLRVSGIPKSPLWWQAPKSIAFLG